MTTIDIEDRLGLTVSNKLPLAIERGEGNRVWDEAGKTYLDFTSGWGVTCLGHAHPVITQAICAQAGKLLQNPNSGFTYSPVRSRLLLKLKEILPPGLERVFFANSGAEANDAAIKLARKGTGRSEVVAALRSFHGRTLATLSVSGGPENGERYLHPVAGTRFVEFGDERALREALNGNTAAVILEPIQGEGGVRLPSPGYLKAVADACRQNGTVFIADEVQTGFCRTGSVFAVNEDNVTPDVLTMGKGIAGGLPFAAMAVNARFAHFVEKGDHGGTYCGNPLVCAVSLAVIDFLISHDVASHVKKMGHMALDMATGLAARYPRLIRKVRGKGLLTALELGSDQLVADLTAACLEEHLLVTPTKNGVIRLIPGLLITPEELGEGMSSLDAALARVATSGLLRSA
jgi:acetylornithine/N-succinyldiaminopimelate aminotransferase